MNPNILKGINYAIVTAVISGFSIFLNKYAVGAISPALLFTGVKNFGVALALTALLLSLGKFSKLKTLTKKDWGLLLAISIIGGTIPFYLFFTGLTKVPAINAALLQKTLIVWVTIFSALILKEKLTLNQFLGIALIFIGNLLVGGFKGFTFSTAEQMILASAVFWGFEYVLAKKALKTIDYDLVAFFRMMLGSIFLLLAMLFSGQEPVVKLTLANTFWVFVSMVLLLGYVTSWYKALSLAPALTVSSILVGSTLITNVLTAVFITKTFSPLVFIQSTLITVGMLVLIKATKKAVVPSLVEN